MTLEVMWWEVTRPTTTHPDIDNKASVLCLLFVGWDRDVRYFLRLFKRKGHRFFSFRTCDSENKIESTFSRIVPRTKYRKSIAHVPFVAKA